MNNGVRLTLRGKLRGLGAEAFTYPSTPVSFTGSVMPPTHAAELRTGLYEVVKLRNACQQRVIPGYVTQPRGWPPHLVSMVISVSRASRHSDWYSSV